MELTLHMDGGSRGNPGPAAAGVVIQAADGRPVFEAGYFLGTATNNVAEYQGLLRALHTRPRTCATRVKIISDSQLLVRQREASTASARLICCLFTKTLSGCCHALPVGRRRT